MRKFTFLFAFIVIFSNAETKAQWSFSTDAGYSYRIVVPNGVDTGSYSKYMQKKRNGINFNFEATYYNTDDGIGLGFSEFLNSVKVHNIYTSAGLVENLSDNISIQYYSIQYHHRKQFHNPRLAGEIKGGFGYIRYHNTNQSDTIRYNDIGNTFGFDVGLQIEYNVYKHITVFAATKFLFATLKEVERNGESRALAENEKEILSHLDFNGGIKFSF